MRHLLRSLTLAAVAGVAAFDGCSVDRPGVGYMLLAAAGGVAGATSASFTITGAPVVLDFLAQPSSGTAGQALTVLNLDSVPPAELLAELSMDPDISNVRVLKL